MRRTGGGAIVNVSSISALRPRGLTAYTVSKGAVIALTRAMAVDHGREGIRVNCVCPGFVETDMWAMVAREQGALLGQTPEEFTRRRQESVPLGRMERPEDVAHVIAFLASPRAAYMTGQALSVDGGLVMHG